MSTDDRTPLMPEDELQAMLAEASELTPDERVTRFLSRDLVLPHTGRTAVLITLDNGEDHTKPNTLGPRSLSAFNTALNEALARDDVAAVAITGKPFILAAGADLKALGGLTGRDQAVTIARIGHAVFDKLHTSPVPSFAFINGLALGGGLEISLHAHYRTVSRAAAGIALPECFLGLLPGWGGTYLLPNLIGPGNAVT
ncbi:MAG TPA: enoyl-CoA hydratase/isomerase family protein, partial [Microlunatus sp.]|nr:enoyl-CoA hydratase/isomerase family protein [Microlunatus sp.]